MLWAQSATKDYIRAEHRLHSISKLFIPQVFTPQAFFPQTTAQILSTISERKTTKTITHVLEPIYIPRALNTGTCIQQGNLFYSEGLHRNYVLATANTGKIRRGFRKNAGEWTGRAGIGEEKIPGSKRSLYGCIPTYSRLKREKI